MKEKVTKVEAVKKVLEENGGKATWAEIYAGISKFYPKAKASEFWQEGIRGVVYREMRYGRMFKFAGTGIITLKHRKEHSHHFEAQIGLDEEGKHFSQCECGAIGTFK